MKKRITTLLLIFVLIIIYFLPLFKFVNFKSETLFDLAKYHIEMIMSQFDRKVFISDLGNILITMVLLLSFCVPFILEIVMFILICFNKTKIKSLSLIHTIFILPELVFLRGLLFYYIYLGVSIVFTILVCIYFKKNDEIKEEKM